MPISTEELKNQAKSEEAKYSWADPLFSPVDTRLSEEDLLELKKQELELNQQLQQQGLTEQPQETVEETQAPANEIEPEVIENEDGSTITIERGPNGIKATLSIGSGGGKEVFHGQNESEVLRSVLSAKLHATKKIREQSFKLKTTPSVVETPQAQTTTRPASVNLSADDVMSIAAKLKQNPDAALEEYFQKKTGATIQQIVAAAAKGQQAADCMVIELAAKEFSTEHPDYLFCEENSEAILSWLCSQKLGKRLTKANYDTLVEELVNKGFYTSESLGEAYDELSEAGLLQVEDEEPDEEDESASDESSASVETKAPSQGIPAGTVSRAKTLPANYGLRSNVTSAPQAAQAGGFSADDLENLSNDEVRRLYQDSLRLATKNRLQR